MTPRSVLSFDKLPFREYGCVALTIRHTGLTYIRILTCLPQVLVELHSGHVPHRPSVMETHIAGPAHVNQNCNIFVKSGVK